MLSYGSDGSPTITMTKTLYSAGEITSTRSESSTSTEGKQGTTNPQSISLTAAPFVGFAVNTANTSIQANSTLEGTSTATGTSTIFNTITVTSTRISTTTVHDSSSSTNPASLTGSNQTSTAVPHSTNTQSNTSGTSNSNDSHAKSNGGTVAGATLGSIAAFGMIGILIWYFCVKKKGKRKIKIKLNLKRRKSSTAKTPQLEDQSMEETRKMMLDRQKNLNDFLKSPPRSSNNPPAAELPGEVPNGVGLKRNASRTESSRTHPSWIGIAVTSSTPPNTPPLPRSHSQRSTKTEQSAAASVRHPPSLMPGFGSQHERMSSSVMPTPLKPVLRPAPIITSPSLARPEHVSPLSPRGMFNAISNTTSKAWRRASQALSPNAYQRVADDGHSGLQNPKRRDSKPRNPELEIGHQTDKGWDGQWI